MLWNVRKIREGFRKKPGKISHNLPFSLLIPDFEMVNSGTGREWKISIPKVWEREGNEKIHSQNSGTGREWKKDIPEIREREGNEKINSQSTGTGIRGLHSWEWLGTGIPAHPCSNPPPPMQSSCQWWCSRWCSQSPQCPQCSRWSQGS